MNHLKRKALKLALKHFFTELAYVLGAMIAGLCLIFLVVFCERIYGAAALIKTVFLIGLVLIPVGIIKFIYAVQLKILEEKEANNDFNRS